MQNVLTAFLTKVSEDEAVFRDFAALAAKHGFDLTELDETELEGVAGGIDTVPLPERQRQLSQWLRPNTLSIIDTNTKGIIDTNT